MFLRLLGFELLMLSIHFEEFILEVELKFDTLLLVLAHCLNQGEKLLCLMVEVEEEELLSFQVLYLSSLQQVFLAQVVFQQLQAQVVD